LPITLSPLVGADDVEALVDEDVVWPVDADVVDLVLAVAQLDNAVDDAAWIGGQCRLSNRAATPSTSSSSTTGRGVTAADAVGAFRRLRTPDVSAGG
jgi:hypothetical protein